MNTIEKKHLRTTTLTSPRKTKFTGITKCTYKNDYNYYWQPLLNHLNSQALVISPTLLCPLWNTHCFLIIKFLVTTNEDWIQFNVNTLYLSGINAITPLFIRPKYLSWAMLRNTINSQNLFCFHLTFEKKPKYTRKKSILMKIHWKALD